MKTGNVCLGAGTHVGRSGGGARWIEQACPRCGKLLTLPATGRIPRHAPAALKTATSPTVTGQPTKTSPRTVALEPREAQVAAEVIGEWLDANRGDEWAKEARAIEAKLAAFLRRVQA